MPRDLGYGKPLSEALSSMLRASVKNLKPLRWMHKGLGLTKLETPGWMRKGLWLTKLEAPALDAQEFRTARKPAV